MPLDSLADARRVGRDEHDRGAGLPLLQGDRPTGHVEEREGTHHRTARVEDAAWMGAQVVEAVGEHHTLGRPGTAAGEEDDVRVVFGEIPRGDVAVVRTCRRRQQQLQGHERRPDLGGDSASLGPALVDDQQSGAGGRRRVDCFLDRESGIHRREDGAQLGQRREQRDDVEVGSRPDGHAVARPDPVGLQRPGQAVGQAVDLAEGDRPRPELGCHAIGNGAPRVPEHIADQQLHPP